MKFSLYIATVVILTIVVNSSPVYPNTPTASPPQTQIPTVLPEKKPELKPKATEYNPLLDKTLQSKSPADADELLFAGTIKEILTLIGYNSAEADTCNLKLDSKGKSRLFSAFYFLIKNDIKEDTAKEFNDGFAVCLDIQKTIFDRIKANKKKIMDYRSTMIAKMNEVKNRKKLRGSENRRLF